MTTIHERQSLKIPYASARDRLCRAFRGGRERRERRRLALHLPFSTASSGIEKTVVVTYERGADPTCFDEILKIRWTPEGGGPYPDFEGELTVRAGGTSGSSILELHGEYVPPFGALGRAFDLVAGARIAASTSRSLLAALAAEMESSYALEQSAKIDSGAARKNRAC